MRKKQKTRHPQQDEQIASEDDRHEPARHHAGRRQREKDAAEQAFVGDRIEVGPVCEVTASRRAAAPSSTSVKAAIAKSETAKVWRLFRIARIMKGTGPAGAR